MTDNEDNFSNENELDLSPLDKITSLIYEELQNQINSFKFSFNFLCKGYLPLCGGLSSEQLLLKLKACRPRPLYKGSGS